jgi:hypothetical protein
MTMIFDCAKRCHSATVHEISPWNETWFLNFNCQPRSYFRFFTNMARLKVVLSYEIYHHTKCDDLMMNGSNFASTSEVWTSTIKGCLKLREINIWLRGYHKWYDLLTEFNRNLVISSKVIREGTQTDRLVIDYALLIKMDLHRKRNP